MSRICDICNERPINRHTWKSRDCSESYISICFNYEKLCEIDRFYKQAVREKPVARVYLIVEEVDYYNDCIHSRHSLSTECLRIVSVIVPRATSWPFISSIIITRCIIKRIIKNRLEMVGIIKQNIEAKFIQNLFKLFYNTFIIIYIISLHYFIIILQLYLFYFIILLILF